MYCDVFRISKTDTLDEPQSVADQEFQELLKFGDAQASKRKHLCSYRFERAAVGDI